MDETLFVDAATIQIPGPYIAHSFLGVPMMVFPYIGALKSWLYEPVFAIFGTSPMSIRLPAILIASAGIVILYPAVRDLVSRPVALLAVTALAFDNSVFWLTRDDVGPTSLELFFKCAVIFCAARFSRTPRVRWIVLLLGALALGVFNKLNFIWVVNATVAVSVVVMLRYRGQLRTHVRAVVTWVAGLAVIYACFAVYYLSEHIGLIDARNVHGNLLGYTWPQFVNGIRAILSGTWYYDYAFAPLAPRDLVVWIVLAMFATGAIAAVVSRRMRNVAVQCLALATLLIALQNLLTAQATAGWHYIAIYPSVTIVAAYGVYVAARSLLKRDVATYVAIACVAIASVAYNGALIKKSYGIGSQEPINPAWTPEIYALSRYVQSSGATAFTADWGIFNPLFALHPRGRYQELAFTLLSPTPATSKAVGEELADTPGKRLLITHGPTKIVFPDSTANLFKALGGHLHLVDVFAQGKNPPVFEVYEYS